jgi:hypothetical protein
MSTQPIPSAELRAIDLPRVNVDAMTDEELEVHRDGVVTTIQELDTILAGRPLRFDIARVIEGRRHRLRLHFAHLQDVRNARQAVRAMTSFLRSRSSGAGAAPAP